MYRKLLYLLLLLGIGPTALAQRVGLVLSGGGAKGLAHVGVLKQLEANGIPIDYIVGNSMGAVVGAMYAAGYSPRDIEQIVLSDEFQNWATGKVLPDKTFNFLTAEPSPSSLRLGLSIDSTFKANISPNLVNDLNLNFALARLLAPAGAAAKYNFDNLFVPYRCLATEVFTRREVVQKSGLLSDAVRNSMAYPLAFRPIRNLDGRYLFDGAVLDNFPTDVMRQDFKPDIIIGVNVGDVAFKKYPYKTDDALLTSTLVFLGTSVADTNSVGKNGIYIQPALGSLGAADFDKVRTLIAKGDTAAQLRMAEIKQRIGRRIDTVELQRRRLAFQQSVPAPRFVKVEVQGLRPDQNEYAQRFFRKEGSTYGLDALEEGYYRLASDDYFRNIYPRIRYDEALKGYVFSVDAQRNNNIATEIGLTLSTRPIESLYLGVEFRYLRQLLYSAAANVSVGRFYNGAQGTFRLNAPGRLPFYIAPLVTYNNWDYQQTSPLLGGNDALNTQVQQKDTKIGAQIGVSPRYRSRLVLDVGAFYNVDNYSNIVDQISPSAVLDRTSFKGGTVALRFARNSLNRKQYATAGRRAVLTVRAVTGTEVYDPGSTSLFRDLGERSQHHQWVQFRGAYERYLPLHKDKSAWGYFGELSISGQDEFFNYRSSLTMAPIFAPLPDSRTKFLDRYRSPSFAAVGLRYSQIVLGKIEWRSEVFAHVNFAELTDNKQMAERQSGVSRPYLTASTGFIVTTPVGPLALHALYYDSALPSSRFGLYAHLGYILFRSRSLE
ncbi:patatin-like phospholipase family protein [Hymenobacter sp. BRD128]|uniref:patatin-like phospholipase family protein n=1 Tax=Hymenobacter sp. BRD128 TaxID=2675878 RepID=UPI0015652469|nr:patatin-like phospholipase family protein [Hymenobacter sp. BRD128]QKG57807.1 patatin-like phospholipase family protein [Hymenobacter sp. BRD128]